MALEERNETKSMGWVGEEKLEVGYRNNAVQRSYDFGASVEGEGRLVRYLQALRAPSKITCLK